MKYMKTEFAGMAGTSTSINVAVDVSDFVCFPAVVGNPNYDQFLVDAQLTDSEVQALTPDTWYDFPKETI